MGTDPRIVLILVGVSLVAVGAKTVVHGVKVGTVKTAHTVVRVFKHPVHSIKNGAIHEPKK